MGGEEVALGFLRTAYEPEDWIALFLKSYVTGCTTQRVGPLALFLEPGMHAWLRAMNAQRFNVYVSVNAIQVSRARRAVIAGQHGDLRTFQVCCRITRGFGLNDDDAFFVLSPWNCRCNPPWTERELRDKIARARRYGREPIGALL